MTTRGGYADEQQDERDSAKRNHEEIRRDFSITQQSMQARHVAKQMFAACRAPRGS
jgi:hypothetical protein